MSIETNLKSEKVPCFFLSIEGTAKQPPKKNATLFYHNLVPSTPRLLSKKDPKKRKGKKIGHSCFGGFPKIPSRRKVLYDVTLVAS